MENRYEIRGEVTVIFIDSKKYGTIETQISTSKLARALELPGNWYVHFNKLARAFYVQGNVVVGKKTAQLHRWIIGAGEGMFVDHINHDTLDNTDGNLRLVTPGENSQNKVELAKNNRSGARGVYWDKSKDKWRACFKKNGKRVYVGLFDNVEDAAKAVRKARSEHMPYSSDAPLKT